MTYSSEVLADSPLAYWRLGEASGTTAVDSSGNGRDGTYGGSYALAQSGALTDPDTALGITGTTGRMNMSGASWMNVSTWTVEAFVKKPAGANARLVVREPAATPVAANYPWSLQSTSTDKLTPVVYAGGTAKVYSSTAGIGGGAWHHVAVTWDGTTIRMYVDGAASGTGTPGGAISTSSTTDITVGNARATSSDLNYGVNGVGVDEVAFYGSALSAARILAHYNAGIGVQSATGIAPVSVGSSSSASTVTTTTGFAPVSVGSSSAVSLVTTGLSPIGVGSSSATSLTIALTGWTADLSQQTLLEITSDDVDLDYTPPVVAVSGPDYLPPVGALALPPATLTERVIMRHSVTVPAMTPGADHTVHVSDVAYDGYTTVDAVVGVPHVLIGGQDYTYLRGAPVGIGSYRAEQPFGDVSLVIDLPQITPQDTPGTGDLAALKPDASVDLVMLNGTTMTRLWAGSLVSDDGGNDERAPRTAWTAQGTMWQASTFGHRVPTMLQPTDIGTLIANELNGVVGRKYPPIKPVVTGILSTNRGSSGDSALAYCQSLLASAWTSSGQQWTVRKKAGTARTYEIALKDIATVHATVTTGARGIDLNLSRDMTSTANCLLGRGTAPNGFGWSGMVWPNLHADTAPAYPYSSGATVMNVGDTDAGTLTGHGVSDWQRRVNDLNLTKNVPVDGVFNTSDSNIAKQIQRAMGLLIDGIVGPQTWDATFSVGSMSGDLSGAYRRPLAIDTTTEPNLYSASGAVTGKNPGYTGARRWERDTDYGPGVTKAEAEQSAALELARDKNPGLTGTAVVTEDPREMSRFLLTPGMNIKILGYNGADKLLHIADVTRDWNALAVTLTVDEHARDSITLAAIRSRNKAAQVDPARRPGRTDRRSRQIQDQVVPYDGESNAGIIPRHAIYGGLWTVIRIPLSEAGDFAKVAVQTLSPTAKFSLWLFAGPVTPAHLVNLVGDPLSGTNPTARTEAKGNALDDLGLIEAFGGPGSAVGYSYGTEGTDPITGWLKDNGGGHYNSTKGGWIWIAEWSPTSTFIEGRISPAPTS